eukprot:gene23226-biopygen8500
MWGPFLSPILPHGILCRSHEENKISVIPKKRENVFGAPHTWLEIDRTPNPDSLRQSLLVQSPGNSQSHTLDTGVFIQHDTQWSLNICAE